MMNFGKPAFLTCVFLATATMGQAKLVLFDCNVDASSVRIGIVTARYLFEMEPGSGKARVNDGLIQDVAKKPIDAKVSEDSDSRISLFWTINAPDSAGNYARLSFHATYFKGNKSILVAGQVGGGNFSGADEARGTCTMQ